MSDVSSVRNIAELLADAPYKWEQGPQQVRSLQAAYEHGLNCVSLSHLALESLGVMLPKDLHCYEMWEDIQRTRRSLRPVEELHVVREGDVVILGLDRRDDVMRHFSPRYSDDGFLKNYADNPLRHVAVCTGEVDEASGTPIVLHTNHHSGVEIASLDHVRRVEEHAKVYGIGRAIALGGLEP